MKHRLLLTTLVVALCLPTSAAFAVGTPAGTTITNQATAQYNVGPTTFTKVSNLATTTVAELIDATVTWQDAAPITVAPGDTDQATMFLVTNTGNGSEAFTLIGQSTIAGDDFDPTLNDVFFDTNGNGVFDIGIDVQYIPGTNDPSLLADSSVVVFLVNNIPTTPGEGALGNTRLSIAANTGVGLAGTVIAGAGDGGVDAILGTSGGGGSVIGTYVVSTAIVTIAKSVLITDQFGGSSPIPGATMTYSLVVTVGGTGTATGMVITDVIPANTTYVAGSLELNATGLSDALDADAGDVGGTTPGVVTVSLGDVSAPGPIQTITFAVTIN